MSDKTGFDSKRYLKLQSKAIFDLVKRNKVKLYIEFGGKLLDDKHAARVLPGYKEDAKMGLLSEIVRKNAGVIFVVSSKDILRKRIRGDHKITYDKETIRLIDGLKGYGVFVRHVVISLVPKGPINRKIKHFQKILAEKDILSYIFYDLDGYDKKPTEQTFGINPFLKLPSKIICVISPGGGSGKFGVCLSQLQKEMQKGTVVDYIKIETFPLKKFTPFHPINLAFMAASIDFHDSFFNGKVRKLSKYGKGGKENIQLGLIANQFKKEGKKLRLHITSERDINVISDCIIDDELIEKEASAEIGRRLIRYKFEVRRGQENKKVLYRMKKIISLLCETSL